MMRILLFLLCLVVCFLFGVLYGVDQHSTERGEQVVEVTEAVTEEETVEENVVVMAPSENVEEVKLIQSENTPAYKAASALESIVDFFYNIVVEVLYQVSKLFY